MASISSTSTLAEVQASYDDNASYAEDGSVAKARAFETACRVLIGRRPLSAGKDGENISLPIPQIQEELRRVRTWLAAAGGGVSRVKHADLRGYRS